MNTTLKFRITKIAAPDTVERDLKRNARFGKLNVSPGYDLTGSIRAVERKSDIRHAFARHASGEAKVRQEFWGR